MEKRKKVKAAGGHETACCFAIAYENDTIIMHKYMTYDLDKVSIYKGIMLIYNELNKRERFHIKEKMSYGDGLRAMCKRNL